MAFVLALIGYAIGTAQILLIDWEKERRQHIRHLRLVRTEFRRAREFLSEFGWQKGVVPTSDAIPYPPRVSDQFMPTIASIDYYRSDEHDQDNSQQGHLNILDGIAHMENYHRTALDLLDRVQATEDRSLRRELLDRAVENTTIYDKETRRMAVMLDSALADIDRRLEGSSFLLQLRRIGRTLPQGTNPPPLTRDDPRIPSSTRAPS